MIRSVVIRPELRNLAGYSLGLEHPFVYGKIHDVWMIWHRETGKVACRWAPGWRSTAMRTCYAMNGIPIGDAASRLAMDAVP
jgi:hypothetical protein